MQGPQRYNFIAEKVMKKGSVLVTELSRELKVSLPTIRRDLHLLEMSGLVQKVHGGAVAAGRELSFNERGVTHHNAKRKAAETAAALVEDNDVIFLDAGTTVFQMVPFLQARANLVVITNSTKTAVALANYPNVVHQLVGGRVKPQSCASVGPEAIENIKRFRVRKLFLGADGVGRDNFTVQDKDEAMTKRAMMEIADKKYLVVDSSKAGHPTFVEVGKRKELTAMITEKT